MTLVKQVQLRAKHSIVLHLGGVLVVGRWKEGFWRQDDFGFVG